jgi:O-antigen biosynthesis protein
MVRDFFKWVSVMNPIDYDVKSALYSKYYNEYLPAFIPTDKTVLDVGCSCGQLGRVLIKQKNCAVFGVDISSRAVAQAQQVLHRAEVMDVERDALPFIDQLFEVIIFCDILEHLLNPEQVLIRFQRYLTADGIMVVSIPNVANISIRLRLLLGHWDYTTSGILDEGHLHFYTQKTMRSLFEHSGLAIVSQGSAPRFCSKRISAMWPTMLANQFLFVLEPAAR